MKSRTFRLEESDVELLKQLADKRGETQSEAIRFAIRNAQDATQEQYDYAVVDLLREEVLDLRERLDQAQTLIDQEQRLRLAEIEQRPEVKLIEAPRKKTWRERLFGE